MAKAQTKQRKRPAAAKPGSRNSAKTNAKSSSRAKAKSRPRARSRSNAKAASGTGAAEKAGSAANGAAANGSSGVSWVASRAKVPLVAGSAALIGAAGGIAYGASHSGGKVMGIKMPRPKRLQLRSSDLREAAKDVGHLGDRVGDLAVELRRAKEGGGTAPIEVLLRALTARR